MKKIKTLLSLLSLSLILSACIYESEVPIDEPSVKVSPRLLFTWEDPDGHDKYKITALDEYNYAIEVTHPNNKTTDKLQAYASIVDDKTFLNVWDAKKKASRSYQLLKLKLLNDSSLVIYPLTDNIKEKYLSSPDLKKFISENMDKSFFYEKEVQFKRMGSK